MRFSVAYTDKNGVSRMHTLKKSESAEALKNDYYELMRTYDKRYVKIERIRAEYGEALHLRITVYARSHYLTSLFDKRPKVCESMSVEVICYPGYPLKAVTAKYDRNHYLASPNVFKSGIACIDRWKPLKSSLLTVVEKLVMDIIHNPTVTRYDSMANSELSEWHYKGCKSGEFPTVDPALLYAQRDDTSGSCLPPPGDTPSCLPPRGDTAHAPPPPGRYFRLMSASPPGRHIRLMSASPPGRHIRLMSASPPGRHFRLMSASPPGRHIRLMSASSPEDR